MTAVLAFLIENPTALPLAVPAAASVASAPQAIAVELYDGASGKRSAARLDSTQLAVAMLLDQNDFSSKFAVVSDRENYVTSLSNAFQIFS